MNTAAATMPQPRFRGFSPGITVAACALSLTLLGLVVLNSAGQGTEHGAMHYFVRQSIYFAIALTAGVGMALINLDDLRRYSWILALVGVALLAAVLSPHIGVWRGGARRWLDLGPVNAQPSDFGKLALIFCLAHYLALNQRHMRTFWRGFVAPLGLVGLFAGLVILEPDFGTAALCGVVGVTLLYLAGTRLLFLFPSALMLAAGFSLAVYHNPLRLKRVLTFLDLEANKNDGTYQLWQGILGFGSGGLEGAGLGQGRQQLYFLPEAHTDFVMAVVGEEMGLYATAGIVLLFLLLFVTAFRAMRRAPNLYEFTLAAGALLLMVGQALINMGVVTALLPTKGMSLPFISYGGSNLVLMYVLTGLLFNLFRRWEKPVLPEAREL